jgi:spermidine/putrescine transport system ATP-binding protein/putrescine transport system ATP-binding protein
MTPDPFLSIAGVSKRFGSFTAVDSVSLEIRRGEFFSLLGGSGSGKTTLLRMLAGFEPVSTGDITLDGASIRDMPPYLRPINMVFQNYAIFPHLNVADNIGYGLRGRGAPRAEIARKVAEMLEVVQLPGYGTRRAHELSGGQRQRVALARALVLRPKVLLLDEPLGALDKRLREQMQEELRRLQRAVGITFVFVTHDQEEALALSDRIGVMADGRVLQADTPDMLYRRPGSRAVAAFIGNMNFLEAEVIDRANGHVVVDVEGLGRRRLAAAAVAEQLGRKLCVAIRPERLTLTPAGGRTGERAASGRILSRTYLGERSHFRIEAQGCRTPMLVSRPDDGPGVPDDSPVWLDCHDDDLLFFARD